jgi:hypothetical protein
MEKGTMVDEGDEEKDANEEPIKPKSEELLKQPKAKKIKGPNVVLGEDEEIVQPPSSNLEFGKEVRIKIKRPGL